MPFHSGAEAAPSTSWRIITPSDTANLPAGCRGIYVGGAGDLVLVGDDNAIGLFKAVPVGTFMPTGPKRVNLTNTTATLLMGLW